MKTLITFKEAYDQDRLADRLLSKFPVVMMQMARLNEYVSSYVERVFGLPQHGGVAFELKPLSQLQNVISPPLAKVVIELTPTEGFVLGIGPTDYDQVSNVTLTDQQKKTLYKAMVKRDRARKVVENTLEIHEKRQAGNVDMSDIAF